jgi:hypothetical protein
MNMLLHTLDFQHPQVRSDARAESKTPSLRPTSRNLHKHQQFPRSNRALPENNGYLARGCAPYGAVKLSHEGDQQASGAYIDRL